jgi:hypothetical protein
MRDSTASARPNASAARSFPRLGNFRELFSKPWKNFREIFQGSENMTAKLSNAWKNHPITFPIFGKFQPSCQPAR